MLTIPTTKAGKAACAAWLLILLVNMAVVLIPFVVGHNFAHADTGSYIGDIQRLLNGNPGLYRPPLYLLYMIGCEWLLGEHGGFCLIIAMQSAACVWSAIYLYRLVRLCCPWHWAAIGAMLLYGIFPATLYYNAKIIPESYAVSLMIFLAWWTLRAMREHSQRAAIYATLIIAILLALKPIFIYLAVLYLCTWIWLSIRYKRFFSAILVCVAIFGATYGYAKWMESAYGAPMLSFASTANDYYTAVEAGAMSAETIKDPALKEYFMDRHANNKWLFSEIFAANPADFDLAVLHREILQSKLEHPDKMLNLYWRRICTIGKNTWYPIANFLNINILKHLFPGLWLVYLTIIIAPFVCWRYRRTDYPMFMFSATLWAIITSHIIVLILGAMFDWGRLMSPVFPIWILLFLITVTRIAEISRHLIKAKGLRRVEQTGSDV